MELRKKTGKIEARVKARSRKGRTSQYSVLLPSFFCLKSLSFQFDSKIRATFELGMKSIAGNLLRSAYFALTAFGSHYSPRDSPANELCRKRSSKRAAEFVTRPLAGEFAA